MSPRDDPRAEALKAELARAAALAGLSGPSGPLHGSDYDRDDPDAAERRRADRALRKYSRDVDRAARSMNPDALHAATDRLLRRLHKAHQPHHNHEGQNDD